MQNYAPKQCTVTREYDAAGRVTKEVTTYEYAPRPPVVQPHIYAPWDTTGYQPLVMPRYTTTTICTGGVK